MSRLGSLGNLLISVLAAGGSAHNRVFPLLEGVRNAVQGDIGRKSRSLLRC